MENEKVNNMNESILNSIKKLLGIGDDYTHFDIDIMTHINSIFVILYQMGVGTEPFSISSSEATWAVYLDGRYELVTVKTYIYLRVRLLFDPPASSAAVEAIKETVRELEFRISVTVDPGPTITG